MNDASIAIRSNPVRKSVVAEQPEVRALHDANARIVAQAPVELPVSDVDGGHVLGAALQQTVGEPAGRGADVERIGAADVDAKRQPAHARASLRRG